MNKYVCVYVFVCALHAFTHNYLMGEKAARKKGNME